MYNVSNSAASSAVHSKHFVEQFYPYPLLAYFVKEANPTLAKQSLKLNDGLGKFPYWNRPHVTQVSGKSYNTRADSRLAPSQWETSLQNNAVSHQLGESPNHASQQDTVDVAKPKHNTTMCTHET